MAFNEITAYNKNQLTVNLLQKNNKRKYIFSQLRRKPFIKRTHLSRIRSIWKKNIHYSLLYQRRCKIFLSSQYSAIQFIQLNL